MSRRRLAVGAAIALVAIQGITFLVVRWPWKVFGNPAPPNGEDLQAVLWQVEATLIAVALPVFLVIIQFTGSVRGEIAALPIAEVLRRETAFAWVLAVSIFGIIRGGIDAIWFRGSAVLTLDFALVLVATVGMLAFSYTTLFRLISARAELKEKAFRMFQAKLDAAIDGAWAISSGNAALIERLRDVGVGYSMFAAGFRSAGWLAVSSDKDVLLKDANADDLAQVINQLPRAPAPPSEGPSAAPSGSTDEPNVYLVTLCGQVMKTGSPFLLIRAQAYDDLDPSVVWRSIEPCLTLASDAG